MTPVDTPANFVVRTDRGSVHRWQGSIVALNMLLGLAILVAMIWAASISDSGYALLPFAILAGFEFVMAAVFSYHWGSRAAIEAPLVLDLRGMQANTAQGVIALPWAAVGSIDVHNRLVARVLVIHPRAQVTPQTPGVLIDIPPATWRRITRRGLWVGSRGIRENVDDIAAAAWNLSAGGVTIRGVPQPT